MADETEEEVEAAIAVYGGDCTVIQRSPPHLLVRLQPRTADDISQQFVEAVLVVKANAQYPHEPPMLELKDTKGLEEEKIAHLLSELQDLADELTFNPMLVAICEAALDRLTDMNQPDGNCCFCMFPLVMEDETSELRPFMKLMSCFHCFHSDCFGRWWRWVLQERSLDNLIAHHGLGSEQDEESTNFIWSHGKLLKEVELKCPVCRKSVNAEDLASVWSVLAADLVAEQGQQHEMALEPEIVFTESEIERKSKFDELFKAQQRCGGIIEPKKLEVVVPGMFVTQPATRVPSASCSEPREEAGLASTAIQASESISVSANETFDAKPLSQEFDNLILGQQALDAQLGSDTGGSTKSTRRFNGQSNDKSQRKGRQPNPAGAKKGYWIRRDQEERK